MTSSITVKYKGGPAVTVNLPVITNIEDSFNVMLTETSTIIYGYRNRFVMDLGTKRSFVLTCERVNPPNYNDSSSNWDDWSNGKWMTEFIALLDPWQNLMGQQEGEKSSYKGGFTLNLDSCDTTLYPKMTHNVFLNGLITPTYGVQVMKFTLPLSVGRMTGTDSKTDFVKITLHSNDSYSRTATLSFPKGSRTAMPACPASWVGATQYSRFYAWHIGSSSGSRVYPGQVYQWDSNLDLYAEWKGRLGFDIVRFTTKDEVQTVSVPSGTTRCTVYMIGGGGGGGSYGSINISGSKYQTPGGAGGGGEMLVISRAVDSSKTIQCIVGAGGKGVMSSASKAKGGNGGDTIVKIGIRTYIAHGGDGGEGSVDAAVTNATGGMNYYAGGAPGEDGKTDTDSGTPGQVGRAIGSTVTEENEVGTAKTTTYFVGGGGGAAPLNHKFLTSSTYTSVGGNGYAKSNPGDGIFGGGGGSSAIGGGDGGNGFIWIDFFE